MIGLRATGFLFLLLSACASTPEGVAEAPMQEQSFRVPMPVCDRARVEFGMVDGDFVLKRCEEASLLHGECRFRGEDGRARVEVERIDPEVHIGIGAGRGDRCGTAALSSDSGEWNVGLSDAIPMDLFVHLGSAHGALALGGLRLESMDLQLDDSAAEVDFRAPNPGVLQRLRVVTQAGELSMRGLGNAGLEHLVVDGGSGRIDLEFHGAWDHSARAEIRAGLSEVRIRLPHGLAVVVVSEADLSGAGFRLVDGRWLNAAWTDDSQVHLALNVDSGIGSVDLQQY